MQINRIKNFFNNIPELTFKAKNIVDFDKWKSDVIKIVKSKLPVESAQPLTVVSVESLNHKELIAEKYIFKGFGDYELKGILLRPLKKQPVPFVLVCPGRNANYEAASGFRQKRYQDENVAEQLALSGMATMTIDYGFSTGVDPAVINNRDETNLLHISASLLGYSLLSLIITDFSGCLLWVENQEWFCAGRMAVFGRSMGASIAVPLILTYNKPIVAALSSFLGKYKTIYTKNFQAGGAFALNEIYKYVDLPDMTAAIAPNALQIQHGVNDPYFPVEEAAESAEVIKKSFAVCNQNKKLDFQTTNMGHGTDVKLLLDFLNKTLLN